MKKYSLPKKEQLVLDLFIARVKKSLGNSLKEMVLFGSRARGDNEPDSDLDILVIVEQETWKVRDAVSLAASRVSLDEDVLISPKVIAQTRWDEMRGFTLHKNILRDGVRLLEENGDLVFKPLNQVQS